VWRATVLAPSALLGEIAAKVVLLLGRDRGLRWIDSRPSLAAWVIDDAGGEWPSRRFLERTWGHRGRA
jgi:thiamine biosynthesis lipoprotein ApbE